MPKEKHARSSHQRSVALFSVTYGPPPLQTGMIRAEPVPGACDFSLKNGRSRTALAFTNCRFVGREGRAISPSTLRDDKWSSGKRTRIDEVAEHVEDLCVSLGRNGEFKTADTGTYSSRIPLHHIVRFAWLLKDKRQDRSRAERKGFQDCGVAPWHVKE